MSLVTHISHDSAAPVVVGIRFDELSLVSTDASGRHIEFAKDFSVVYKEVEIYFVQYKHISNMRQGIFVETQGD